MSGIIATILSILLAILRAAPSTMRAVEDRQRRERESRAARRQAEKDALVDDAIDKALRQPQPEDKEPTP